ncbi:MULTISPECIES: phage holin family protein [unclassified Corynebacterium]|uniref:phage holin family protein n=1 Tax=unclassified Corynebacterium TaxID=2624378 RepID=UPI0029CA03FA|nr:MULTISPECIES: phage holin family protein [unclassified Corynebacterium]WPF66317.1 phage holin family protein [Corynebacterium sp. 22KM0430]WPF68807.1 phage holin family protein [Corynebacterium sp. 21KM1197]
MSNKDGFFTDGPSDFTPQVKSIPLSDVDASTGQESIGTLVSNATSQMSSLFRAELELAKTELTAEAKKGAIGGGLFGAAGTIALYSTFFFFMFVAALLSLWLPAWASLLIVFLVMILTAGLLALVGVKKVKSLGAPQKTIDSVNELKNLVPGSAQKKLEAKDRGLYS